MLGRSVITLLCGLVLVLCSSSTAIQYHCFEGTYEFTPPGGGGDVCELCPPGTFMPHKDHSYRSCFNCIQLQDPTLEILISPCNRTHDAVIHCIDGYYRQLPRNPRETGTYCIKCTQCQYPYHEVRPCQIYEDTGCCPGENFDFHNNEDGVALCRERPWLCKRGQYFDLFSFQCLPCPAGTYMSLDYHVETKCSKCRQHSDLLPLHVAITEPCNSTHPDIIQCEEGYFVDHFMGSNNNHIGCSPCTKCSTTDRKYEARKCDSLRDTSCCPEPNMTVVDSDDGPECMGISPSCEEGKCLHHNIPNESTVCKPCPPEIHTAVLKNSTPSTNHFVASTEFSDHTLPLSTQKGCVHKEDTENAGVDRLVIGVAIGFAGALLLVTALIILYRHRSKCFSSQLCLMFSAGYRRGEQNEVRWEVNSATTRLRGETAGPNASNPAL